MAGGLDVVVKFIGDASSITTEASKIEGTGGRLKAWAKGVGAAIAAGFAVRAISDFVTAAEDAEVSSRRLAQTMRNAGDATGKWTKQAEDLATTLMNKTGIDDEQIKNAESILTTFHKVSDATGQQEGVFRRATIAAADLSRAGFGDMDSAAKALGKALQDPEKGITALRRAGVDFTQAQRDQIKAMIDSGDQAGAMKLILKEVENQVGGVAAKTVTSSDKMRVSWQETQEALGRALLPVLERLAPILQKIAGFVQDNAGWLVPLAAAIFGVVGAVKAWAVAQAALNILLDANPIGAIIIGVVALGVAITLLVTHWNEIWDWIANAPWYVKVALLVLAITNPVIQLIAVIKLLLDNWQGIWSTIQSITAAVVDWIVTAFNNVVAFFAGLPGRIGAALSGLWGIITGAFGDVVGWARDRVNEVVSFFAGLPGRVLGALGDLGGALFRKGAEAMGDFLDGLESQMKSIANKVGDFVSDILGKLNPFGSPQTVAFYRGRDVMRDYVAGAQSIQRSAARSFRELGAASGPSLASSAGGGGGVVINVNVSAGGLGADSPEIQRAVVEALRGYVSRNGLVDGVTR